MATWVSHLIVADKVLEKAPWLCRREFCVGNIAPDCNIENGDFTSFTPPREVTHWMRGKHKLLCDAERFLEELVKPREAMAEKELSFLLGYYTHLVTDAEYHRFAIDGERICAAMQRIMACPPLAKKASGKENSWETVK